ncbi:uncharacterized protein LOC115630464 isoform X1 [Scaptodrosophila lebanonensis]|uniref:Uncharacterized protein LOC115630464 isoform X1 n=1 Tax=Drosophila lebanonensis TaxID=7225 RepID=A0A6J2U5U6_DROLE|nr:uncharacterized protein LOC115630464 isoform X1 [Scaptodrosophila lebanonensis]XP_030382893.1 uncharacterized protein LOC115630464 isoform X1 [Scaptodrosophila lebanonensis]
MDDQDKTQQNMISNLPLLFANGYPTSLEKISESQLEKFIPFMVQCSLGHINLPKKIDCSEPEWWPENVPFLIPLKKPKECFGTWMEKMKEIVVICYQFHKSLFLLRFCNDLAAYEHASLRFINNYNSTTSLYDRRNNKLLVTFRNENMSYDRQQKIRKCLLLQKNKNDAHDDDSQQMMVEPAPFDIYLCDNCDAELYSKEAIMEHEKICNIENDVIICDSPEPENRDVKNENSELRNAFLLNFSLQSRVSVHNVCVQHKKTHVCNNDIINDIPDLNRRISRRNRTVHSFSRCSFIPISSPAGQRLLRSIKIAMTVEYVFERQERLERFCYTPFLKSNLRQKIFEKKLSSSNAHCTYKKPYDHSLHIYSFPRRQFSQRRDNTTNFLFLNSPLIKQCRPISVRLKKMTEPLLGEQCPPGNTKLNIRLTRDISLNSNWRISPSNEVLVDTIDLCSSDDDDQIDRSRIISSDTPLSISVSNKNSVSGRQKDSINTCEIPALPSPTAMTENNSLKPLQQSVYIFSNYKTNSVFNRCTVNPISNHPVTRVINTSNTHSDSRQSKEYNQENCNLPKKLINVSDWFAQNPTNSETKVSKNEGMHFENLSVAQTFNSTGRIISIDLTS